MKKQKFSTKLSLMSSLCRQRDEAKAAGAFHSSELWYTFGTCGRCWRLMTEEDETLSEKMVDYWTNFMKTGNPNSDDLPRWEPYRSDDDIMIFDV